MDSINSGEKLFEEFPEITKDEWINKIKIDLKGADFNKKLVWRFDENIDIQPFFMSEDLEKSYGTAKAGPDNNWEIREEIDFGDIEKAASLIEKGAEGLTVKGFDLNDDNAAARLFDNVDLSRTPVHFSSVYSYSKLLSKLKKEALKRGLALQKLKGSFDFDYYSYYLFRREFYNSFEANRKELKVLINRAKDSFSKFRIINVNAKHYHNSGASLVQETAFALAHGAEYLTDLTDEGLSADDILPRMQFTFAAGSSYFPEIAKFRALRFLWKRIAAKFNPSGHDIAEMYINAVSSEFNKAVYDPHVNLLRNTTEIMAAVIGGCDAMTVSPLDAFFKTPDETTRRIARNQQIIIKEEVKLRKVKDPSKGSYYIEKLTEIFVEKIWELFLEISKAGGFRAVLENGFIFDQIEKSARKKDMDIAMRKINILGVNQFPNLNEEKLKEISKQKKSTSKGLKPYRGAEAIEELRLKTERHVAAGNKKPLIFLLPFGDLGMRKARANFALNFFACAGFEVKDNNGFDTINQGLEAASRAGADIIVLCSSDEEYLAAVKEIKAPKDKIAIAGYPRDFADEIKAAGIEHFIHLRSNLIDELKTFQQLTGIK